MKLIKFAAIPVIALATGIGLAACGSVKAPVAKPAVTVTHTVSAKPAPVKTTHSAKPKPVHTTPAPASAPTQAAALPTVSVSINPGTQPQVEPSQIGLSEDGNGWLNGITWSSWTAYGAEGSGSMNVNDCQPSCAQGDVVNVPVSIALSAPTGGSSPYFTAMTVRDSAGNTNTYADTGGPSSGMGTLSDALYKADMAPAAAPTTQANGLPADAWFPAGFPNVACGPPTAGTNGLNTSYLQEQQGSGYIVDHDDPTSSPCNS